MRYTTPFYILCFLCFTLFHLLVQLRFITWNLQKSTRTFSNERAKNHFPRFIAYFVCFGGTVNNVERNFENFWAHPFSGKPFSWSFSTIISLVVQLSVFKRTVWSNEFGSKSPASVHLKGQFWDANCPLRFNG